MEKKFNYIASAKRTLKIESNSILGITKQLNKSFTNFCDEIIASKGILVVMGVGKSGHIGQKIAATLSSTGTGSIFIHPTEAAHGDMGLVNKKDIVLLISNSGETDEIINILPSLKRHSKKIVSLTSNKLSSIAKSSDISIEIKSGKEACPLNLAPTSSTTNALAFGDALAIALLEAKGFSKKDFAYSHPAGKLGKKLITQVKDLMHTGNSIPKVSQKTILDKALVEMTKKSLGITLILNKTKVIGIFTDGDLRRMLEKYDDFSSLTIGEVMTSNPKTIDKGEYALRALNMMREFDINQLIVVDQQKQVVGFLHISDLLNEGIV